MNRKRHPIRSTKGQSLVEYALILGLVALVTIVVVFLIGLGVERVIGLIDGALGLSYNDKRSNNYIDINVAVCDAVEQQGVYKTGLYVAGTTNYADGKLSGSTNLSGSGGMGGSFFPVTVDANNNFKYNPLLLSGSTPASMDLSVCPAAVVIQSVDGAEAVAPVVRNILPPQN